MAFGGRVRAQRGTSISGREGREGAQRSRRRKKKEERRREKREERREERQFGFPLRSSRPFAFFAVRICIGVFEMTHPAAGLRIAASKRSGVNGTRRRRRPVASKRALASAAATGRGRCRPAPRRWHRAPRSCRGHVEDRVARPVDAEHRAGIEADLLVAAAAERHEDVGLDHAPGGRPRVRSGSRRRRHRRRRSCRTSPTWAARPRARAARPSTCTVQAPHCARPQPKRGPC